MEKLYKSGIEILKTLNKFGFEAYFVGGFIRDFILGINAYDIDITTNALPIEVKEIFPKTKDTGIKYGTVTVFNGDYLFEVTTFRSDLNYEDHRRPNKVIYSKQLKEDLKRRDFTINAIAMDYSENIYDMFNGKEDIKNKIIRAIGDPNTRFQEDALRIIRAFRFVSKLGFRIEENTFNSIKKNIYLLKEISIERILVEFKKLIDYTYKEKAISLMDKSGITNVFTELNSGIKLLSNLKKYDLNYIEFFALCFYLEDIEVPEAWRFSNKDKTTIKKIIELLNIVKNDNYTKMNVYTFGEDISLMSNNIQKVINPNNNQENLIKTIYNNLPIYKISDLKFKGKDILKLDDCKNEEIIGKILEELVYHVVTQKIKNNYNELKKYTIKILEKYNEER